MAIALADLVTTLTTAQTTQANDAATGTQAISDAQAAVNAANSALLTATTSASATATNDAAAVLSAGQAIGAACDSIGAFFIVNPDGTASIYSGDNNGSYHVTVAQPGSNPVPDAATTTTTPPTGS
jgi:hypothetical protein